MGYSSGSEKISQDLFMHLDRLYNRSFEIAGISQLSAQSSKPSGLDSGRALREFSDIESERFQRKWTKLDLRSMARRRDVLVAGTDHIYPQRLEAYYQTLYRLTSASVHAEASILTPTYWPLVSLPRSGTGFILNPLWLIMPMQATAYLDILQCYEIRTGLDISCGPIYEELLLRHKKITGDNES